MSSGIGTKIITLYLMVNVFLLIAPTASGDPWLMAGEQGEMLSHFANVSIDQNDIWHNSTVTPDADLNEKMGLANDSTTSWSSGFVASTVNLANLAFNGVVLLAKFFFSPIFYLQAVNAPFPIVLILGVIPSILFVVAFIGWVRGSSL